MLVLSSRTARNGLSESTDCATATVSTLPSSAARAGPGRRVERGRETGGEGERRGRPGHGDEPEAAREAACLIVRAHGRTSRHRSDGKDGLISCQTFDVCYQRPSPPVNGAFTPCGLRK
ncbi:hypothetical protein SPURM210S_02257 [Streptomyces purpurascens]